ncbi:MAG: MmcQ/YjbR family DNA-binding protein [Alphaproteobacteria bacterium]|nr:MmcQ/YjbR family DNA-binding protein [Alphaproteobacteria bacterium]
MAAKKKKTKKTVRKAAKEKSAAGPYAALPRFALSFPEAVEEHPWGETAIKVRGKVFLFIGSSQGTLSLSVKLPQSKEFALGYPFTQPTAYGLGKSGWVSASFEGRHKPPLDLLQHWVTESYRAVAPKKLAEALADRG